MKTDQADIPAPSTQEQEQELQQTAAAGPASGVSMTEEVTATSPAQRPDVGAPRDGPTASQVDERLPFDKNYRPWNRGLKATTTDISGYPTRPDGPALWVEPVGTTRTSKEALSSNAPLTIIDQSYGAIQVQDILHPLRSQQPSRAIPVLERVGSLLENLSYSMMQIIEDDNRFLWSVERLQALLQGDDAESGELQFDMNDRQMIKCKDVTQDLINVRKAYIEALSSTRQRIMHLLHSRQWLVAHLKEVEKNDSKHRNQQVSTSQAA